jgi:hypothetical protein
MPKQRKPTKDVPRAKPLPRDRTRLAREASKLDPKEEQAMAEEGIARDLEEWPDY